MVALSTRVALWGRAGGRCCWQECRRPLTYRPNETADPSLVGDVCHIRSKTPDGPRYDPDYPVDLLDAYDNVLLLCKIHHKIIDDHPDIYAVDKLCALKDQHESWIDSQLSVEEKRYQEVKEKYSEIIGGIESKLDFAEADRWLSCMANSEYPNIKKEFADTLFDFPTWATRQMWPNSIPKFEACALNLVQVVDDYTQFFVQYSSTKDSPGFYMIPKFYQSGDWDEERYERQSKKWEKVIGEARERSIEIGKALNLLVDVVRTEIAPDYRGAEGWFIVPGVFADKNLSAAAVPRYDRRRKIEILADPKYKSIFYTA
jgi:hypothetical protein